MKTELHCKLTLDDDGYAQITVPQIPGFHFPVEMDTERLLTMLEDGVEDNTILGRVMQKMEKYKSYGSAQDISRLEIIPPTTLEDSIDQVAWWAAVEAL